MPTLPISSTPFTAQSSNQRRARRHRPDSQAQLQRARLPSPPKSLPTPERPVKRLKTYHEPGQEQVQGQHGANNQFTTQFWDNLTRIPLTKSALRELDRRTRQTPRPPRPSRPDPDYSLIIDRANDRELQRYARHGGPDLSDLRWFDVMPPSSSRPNQPARGGVNKTRRRGSSRGVGKGSSRTSSRTSSQTKTKKTKSTSPYDRVFKQHLVDFKVWPIGHWLDTGDRPPSPENWQEIVNTISGATSRASLEPDTFSQDDFKRLQKAYDLATSEEAQSRTLDAIEGSLTLRSSHVKRGPVKSTNLTPLTPDNLVPGYPDRAYGARAEALDRSVRHALGHLILPTAAQDILCPNFIVHVKGPGGDPEVADLQAVYDGALAARGMEALWEFGSGTDGGMDGSEPAEGQSLPGGHRARTLACTFAQGILRMYTVHLYTCGGGLARPLHMAPVQSGGVAYSTSRIGTWVMYDNLQGFCEGAAAFRNGLEWAREHLDEAIRRANSRVSAEALLAGEITSADGPGSADSSQSSSAHPDSVGLAICDSS